MDDYEKLQEQILKRAPKVYEHFHKIVGNKIARKIQDHIDEYFLHRMPILLSSLVNHKIKELKAREDKATKQVEKIEKILKEKELT